MKKVKISKNEIYLFGISAGAQFAHRFALWAPDMCVAVAAHAAGGMSYPDRWIPVKFLITVGENDIAHRKEKAYYFVNKCKEFDIYVEFKEYPNIGHEFIDEQTQQSLDFFVRVRNTVK